MSMERLILKITPLSSFGTYPKGDTLFGQILAYLFLNKEDNKDILNMFNDYLDGGEPKLIISDMMPYGYVYRPILPRDCFKSSDVEGLDKKKLRKKKFITLSNLQNGNLDLCEEIDFMNDTAIVRNSINRMTFTTDDDTFSPYGEEEKVLYRELWMFILVESSIKEKTLETIIDIGKYGFGKDANIGKGVFSVEPLRECWEEIESPYYMSLSPTLLTDTNIAQSWYEPFTRFGKYGLHHSHTNPFKKPILMADSGAVVKLEKKNSFFGACLNNGTASKISHLQGYSLAIPFKIKDLTCLD